MLIDDDDNIHGHHSSLRSAAGFRIPMIRLVFTGSAFNVGICVSEHLSFVY